MGWKEQMPKEHRYFETENGILYCGDSLEILQDFPKESIDLVFTDPPYLAKFKHLYYESARLIQPILKNNTFAIYYASDYWFGDVFPRMLNYLDYFGLFHLELPGQNALLFPRKIIIGCKTIDELVEIAPKELARVVIPLGAYTEFVWKVDSRNLYHFLEQRLSEHAQPETRNLAKMILNKIRDVDMLLYNIYTESLKKDGINIKSSESELPI